MNTDYAVQRSISDIQSKIANLNYNVMAAAQRARPRPGGLCARYAATRLIALAEKCDDADVAKQYFRDDTDLSRLITLKTAMAPAQTGVAGWAAELVATVVQDVAENLLPQSALAQLRSVSLAYGFIDGGVARVPVHAPTPSGGFIPEGGAIPVGALIFTALNLKPRKAAGIIAVTKELLQGSAANIEVSLQTLLSQDIGLTLDGVLLGSAAATASQPAGLLAGLSSLVPSTGGGLGALVGDLKLLMAAISPALRPCLIMNAGQAAIFDTLAETKSLPVITAPYLPADTVIALDAAAFASAIGVPDFNVNENPTIHMESAAPLPISAPGSPNTIAAPVQSLWQTRAVGMRTLIDCDWMLRRANAIAFVTGTTW